MTGWGKPPAGQRPVGPERPWDAGLTSELPEMMDVVQMRNRRPMGIKGEG